MEFKQIKELMAAMERLRIKKLSIKEADGFEVHLESERGFSPEYTPQERFEPAASISAHSHPVSLHPEKKEEKVEGKYVTSPMVGTYYSSPSPEDAAFVKVGDKVSENSVLCIIEAMKVMNEVKAHMSGTVAEICVESSHPVEFGTQLFRIV